MSINRETSTTRPAAPQAEPQEAQGPRRIRRPGRLLKLLMAAIALLAAAIAVYFLAIVPRVQNNQQLQAAAAAASKRAVTVVEPTQTSSAPELNLPGNVHANQQTSVYARIDGYIQRWYVDIGVRVQQGQVLAEIRGPADRCEPAHGPGPVRTCGGQP